MNPQTSQPATGKPIDALLAGYSAGTLDPATHVLVASHLILKPGSRRFVAALEDLGGSELAASPPSAIDNRDQRLAAIFDEAPAPRRTSKASVLPAPLLHFVGQDVADLKWRTKLPGVKEYRIADSGGGEASLLLVKAGRRMPSHTHEGSEITLVLKGGFSDTTGHYGRGDIAIADAELDHRPVTDEDGDCLCFAVTDAPLHLTGPFGRIIDRLFGRH